MSTVQGKSKTGVPHQFSTPYPFFLRVRSSAIRFARETAALRVLPPSLAILPLSPPAAPPLSRPRNPLSSLLPITALPRNWAFLLGVPSGFITAPPRNWAFLWCGKTEGEIGRSYWACLLVSRTRRNAQFRLLFSRTRGTPNFAFWFPAPEERPISPGNKSIIDGLCCVFGIPDTKISKA